MQVPIPIFDEETDSIDCFRTSRAEILQKRIKMPILDLEEEHFLPKLAMLQRKLIGDLD